MNKSKTFGRVSVLGATIFSMLAPAMAHASLDVRQAAQLPKTITPGEVLSTQTQGQAPAGTTPVTPGKDAAWIFASEGLGGPQTASASSFQGYGLAPSGAPSGVGAFHQRIGAGSTGDSLSFGTQLVAGRHLGSISELSYSTYMSPNGSASDISPALQLTLDLDGDGVYSGFAADDILVFEPHHQRADRPMLDAADVVPAQCGNPCIAEGVWKNWNARTGAWYSRRGDGTTRWNGINFESIEHYLSRYPSATIATNPASLTFRSGSGWTNVENYIDTLKVDGTTYDFEPTIEAITPRTPDWRFESAFNGVSEFNAAWSNSGSRIGTVDGTAFTGTGSSQQVISPTGGNDHVSYGTAAMAGTRLDELNDLSYATYVEPGSLRPPVLSLRIDVNRNGVWENNVVDDTLQYVASNQSTPPVTGSWQFWPTLSGEWFSRGKMTLKPMSHWIATYANAAIALSDASLMVSLGTGYSNVRAYADSISVNGKLFDIETADQLVSPADGAGGWYYNPPLSSEGTSGDRQALVNGPTGSPAGVGSLSQRSNSLKLAATTPLYAGKRLRDLTSLSYWTYRKTTSHQLPALKIHLDLDGDGFYSSATTDALLVFEPPYQHSGYVTPGQGTLQTNAWQRWDATEGGWYVASRTLTGPCNSGTGGPPVCKLADLINTPTIPGGVKYGDLKVALGPNSIDIQTSGTGSPDVFSDRLTVNGTTFNFEASIPAPLPTAVDGNRSSDEGYRLLAYDTTTTGGPLDLAIYGTCSETDNYLYIESPNSNVYTLNLLFDVNQNDAYNGAPTDRQASIDNTGVMDAASNQPIPNASSKRSFNGKGYEIKIPRAYNGGGWVNYDVWNDSSVRNTGWHNTTYAQARTFIPEPCTYTPTLVNGSVAVDCNRTENDIRLVQHLLDRGLGTKVKLHGTCDISASGPHGGDQVKVTTAAFVVDRDGVTIESLDPTNKAKIIGSGTQAAFYVAPGTKDVTIRSLWMQGVSRGIVAQNTTRTTIGYQPLGTQSISPFGNRIIGVGNLQEGILAVAAGDGMNNGGISNITVKQGNLSGGNRTYSIASGGPAEDLKDVLIAGNYISYSPSGPLTTTSDVTGIVVRQNGVNRDVFGAEVSQNGVGMASSEFPSFNYAGIRIHSDSNDPNTAHIQDVVVFKNTLGRMEELNLSEAGLPDAGDLQATGRTGIAIGRVQNFVVQGNSIRTILSAVPGMNMIGGGIVVYDSFDGHIETNSVITIAGANTEDEDLGAIAIVDDLMSVFDANGASGKPTKNIWLVSNYAGWATSDATTVGTQRGIVINGASKIRTTDNQMKLTSSHSLLISIPIPGVEALGGPAMIPALPVTFSQLCTNWLDTYSGSNQPKDKPLSEVRFGGRTNGSTGNVFPGGSAQGNGNSSC